MAITIKLVDMTPERAAELLENNDVNRNPRPKLIEAYAGDMAKGLFRSDLTVEPLKVSRTGRLLDGQNRLMAIVRSGLTVKIWLATGLDDEAQKFMDLAAARTASDIAKLSGVKNATHTMSIGRCDLLNPDGPTGSLQQNLKAKASPIQQYHHVQSTPDIELAAEAAMTLRGHLPGTPSSIGYAWLQMYRVDPADCHTFFASFVNLEFKALDDPRKAVLKKLQLMDREMTSANKDKMFATVSVLTRGWNAWRKGEGLGTIAHISRGKLIAPVTPI